MKTTTGFQKLTLACVTIGAMVYIINEEAGLPIHIISAILHGINVKLTEKYDRKVWFIGSIFFIIAIICDIAYLIQD